MNDTPPEREETGGRLGLVIIGRNEGERLRRCLESVLGRADAVVYVDSGSTDGSADLARSLGAEVVELDLSQPFTAARARNEGWRRLLTIAPGLAYVQFVDGDCEIVGGWLDTACAALDADPALGAACGRVRERHPEATIYNRLCDLEWDTPVGAIAACGGIVAIRAQALKQVGGYDPAIIAAEDDDLCVRMRARGWTIRRLDAEMCLHDANMTRASQWWKRMTRAGHAFAQVREKHRGSAIPHFARECRSVWVWGGVVPLFVLAVAMATWGVGLLLLLPIAYGYLSWRVARFMRRRGFSRRHAWLYGVHCALAKFPQFVGLLKYWRNRLDHRPATIIEYKHAEA